MQCLPKRGKTNIDVRRKLGSYRVIYAFFTIFKMVKLNFQICLFHITHIKSVKSAANIHIKSPLCKKATLKIVNVAQNDRKLYQKLINKGFYSIKKSIKIFLCNLIRLVDEFQRRINNINKFLLIIEVRTFKSCLKLFKT